MEDKIKILMTADTVGGVWTYALSLCKGLLNYNAEIHLMTMGGNPDKQQLEEANRLSNVYLYCSDYKLEWMDDPWADVKLAAEWIKSVYDKINPDIIHFNNFVDVNHNWSCPVITVFHSCVHTWWRAVKGEDAPPEWENYKQLVKKSISSSDIVIAPSRAILNEAQAVYGKIPSSKVIYNGSDFWLSEQSREKEPFILTAGRVWDEAKNIYALSEIADELDWPVYIAGNNINPSNAKVKIPENVHFLGPLSHQDLQVYMQRAAIFVMPARYEPFGLAVLEAAQAGCALVLGQIKTLEEIWQDTAVYVPPYDPAKLLRTLNHLIQDKELRSKLSSLTSLRSKNFTQEKMVREYQSLYKELLRQKEFNHMVSA
ncbi:glycosyltransferase family 4 protein [Legionella jordanis]|uniref:CapM protein, capsular polysaccharide biosynthesis n=1 Tax=Legionella jordanis TaxID=456 RepID=A0A0W0VFX7_9GAMM|nr:glycosyltransferase family 4 protein [Legionella jordanis]KTD19054.1 CapM protein, capsular polysaccharide biosynthesis [Legionella jordanis]RMX05392.1 glycosyltransferase family 1 protein [Legionella jordanis]VEH13157.1 CapM protein, capsular polysaccharide biosynthesis [Legionella jordanis]HAT8714814.1 glycosyltransferase [Legionella jordanis]